jgi:predicted nucleic acid-binding protein
MGLTVLDSGVLIAILDRDDAHHAMAVAAVSSARDRHDELVVPVSAYAEAHVSPSRSGVRAVQTYDGLIDRLPSRVEPATRAIGAAAADLRARFGSALKLPDALVIATAHVLQADRIITTDQGWPVTGIPVEIVAGA